MNIQQINNEIAITDFLSSQGIQPAYKRGCDWWYVSPARMAERTPSFKVNTRLNRWYDHGSGEGGKIFDLAMRLHRGAGTVCLLEGFMDFLSLLELQPNLKASVSFLVLNSLAQLSKSLNVLGQHRQVLLFLDND